MAEEKDERLQGSFNYATDLNRSFNSATNLVQTVSQPQQVNTGGGSGTTANANANSSLTSAGSESGAANKK